MGKGTQREREGDDFDFYTFSYGYAIRNEFKINNAVMKFDFDDPTLTKFYELRDGEFGTEPAFVGRSDADGRSNEDEDDGYVLVQTIDARAKKASISILDAKDMTLVFRGLAPELGLFGLHTRFFPFDVGCSTDDCVPKDDPPSSTNTPTTTTTISSSATTIFLPLLSYLISFVTFVMI